MRHVVGYIDWFSTGPTKRILQCDSYAEDDSDGCSFMGTL